MKAIYKGQKTKYYKYGNTPDVGMMGSPTVNNGVVSGFSSSNYVMPFFNFLRAVSICGGKSWELGLKFTTGTSTNSPTRQIIFQSGVNSSATTGSYCYILDIYQNNLRSMYNYNNGAGSADHFLSAATNTLYYYKITYDKDTNMFTTQYKLNEADDWTTIGSTKVGGSLTTSSKWNFTCMGNTAGETGYYLNNGSIDFKECYLKFDGKYIWHGTRQEESYYDNLTIIGSPKLEDGVLSGFSLNNYAQIDSTYKSTNNADYVVKIRTGDDITTCQTFFNTQHFPGVNVNEGNLESFKTQDGTRPIITPCQPNTDYWVKMNVNGTTATIQYSEDGITWNDGVTFTDTAIAINNKPMRFGVGVDVNGTTSEAWVAQQICTGSVYIDDCYIDIDGERVWQLNKVVADEDNYDFSRVENIYELPKKDGKWLGISG